MILDPTYIRASDGNGEAVRAIVTEDRGIGNMDLIVDSVLNFPPKFVATVGTIDETTGYLDPLTMTIGYAHLTGSIITFDEFAPGYNDIGNTADQIVLIKPTTEWANLVAELIGSGGASVTISDTAPADPAEGDLWGDTNGVDSTTAIALAVGNLLHPIGSIYMSVSSANPSTYLGFGTWTAWGSGRVPVGVDTGQTEFDTVEETGGAKTHTLTESEMPAHRHSKGHVNFSAGPGPANPSSSWAGILQSSSWGINMPDLGSSDSGYPQTGPRGGGGAHNNLQPYITCYMWKRTA